MAEKLTAGVHHVGLTVSDLEASAGFFEALGFDRIGGRPDYPSVFVSDGSVMLTIWQAKVDTPTPFDRTRNIGLHHLCIRIASADALTKAFEIASGYPGAKVEFEPETVATGNGSYAMVYEPSGNRIELRFMEG
ncbi:MAG: VOC family protein [Paracoccaceae bacterium]